MEYGNQHPLTERGETKEAAEKVQRSVSFAVLQNNSSFRNHVPLTERKNTQNIAQERSSILY